MSYRLLDAFRATFEGQIYRHRVSTHGDRVALYLYEDLYGLNKSDNFCHNVDTHQSVVNGQNTREGIRARRGDGTFGEAVPGAKLQQLPGFRIAGGSVATIEIGAEVKILAKAMIKQIDRVINDLRSQVDHFRRGGGNPISVGIVGINYAPEYTSYEKDRSYPTDGRNYPHPAQEAAKAEARIETEARPKFDHFMFLRFRASNVHPFPFEWIDERATELQYAAVITRIVRDYDRRF